MRHSPPATLRNAEHSTGHWRTPTNPALPRTGGCSRPLRIISEKNQAQHERQRCPHIRATTPAPPAWNATPRAPGERTVAVVDVVLRYGSLQRRQVPARCVTPDVGHDQRPLWAKKHRYNVINKSFATASASSAVLLLLLLGRSVRHQQREHQRRGLHGRSVGSTADQNDLARGKDGQRGLGACCKGRRRC